MRNGNDRTVLVLGATGGIGGEVARTLLARGWNVHAMRRGAPPAAGDRITWHEGDAMNASDVLRAARGARVIVHAVNPPGYRRWSELVLPMMDNTIAAAKAVGARVVLPGTVYNFGPDTFPVPREDAPQRPLTRKGAIRVEMERRLRDSGVPAIVVRAGDYFGPRVKTSSWFAQGLVKAGAPVTTITQPGRPGVGHQWAYLPDVAETIARLLERDQPGTGFERFHMAGHWDPDGTRMAEAITRAATQAGLPAPRLRRFPWALAMLAAPFVPLLREVREMRYLWEQPIQLQNERLAAALGSEPHTPWDEAVAATLAGLGCLPTPRDSGRARASGVTVPPSQP